MPDQNPPLRKPIAAASAAIERRSTYPEPFKSRMGDRAKQRLGDLFGLDQFGVNLVTLGPGAQSALRHWHSLEDEFVYLLSGELVLATDAGETVMRAGDCVGYKAGLRDAHLMINRSGAPAVYLEVGSRVPGDNAFYPDDDLIWVETADGVVSAHKDGGFY